MQRCEWCLNDPLYLEYHDKEWGVPVHDDNKLFEFLILEGAQAGLSWLTVLKKRKDYRIAYKNFDPEVVADFGKKEIDEMLGNKKLIRNRLKINSSIKNAVCFQAIQKEFGSFDKYIWSFVNNNTIVNKLKSFEEMPSITPVAEKLSKDLKKRGFKFVGPTIVYAMMQAIGMVNDHYTYCYRYKEINDQIKNVYKKQKG